MVIRFFASIRNVTGVKEIEWGEPTPTLGDLLYSLSERYGPQFRNWVLEGEGLGSSVMVVINGDDVRHQGGIERRLAPTDVVSILPIMAGGGGGREAVSGQLSAISFQKAHEETWGRPKVCNRLSMCASASPLQADG
jgi:molybdopterin synthase sulfur carrier subunit